MARKHTKVSADGTVTNVLFTAAEETARDSEEAAIVASLPARQMAALRLDRDTLLAASDYRFLADTPSGRGSEAWITYRQELRDLPATADPANPTWPIAPE
jgi:hypothetical protein